MTTVMLAGKVYMVQSEDNRFRFVEAKPYIRADKTVTSRFLLEEWCPIIGEYVRCLWYDKLLVTINNKCEDWIENYLLDTLENLNLRTKVIMYGPDNTLYLANTTEQIGRACIKLVKEGKEKNFYHTSKEPVNPNIDPESFSDKEMKEFARQRVRGYKLDLERYNKNKEENSLRDKALAGDYISAYDFLMARSSREYENFEIRGVEVV